MPADFSLEAFCPYLSFESLLLLRVTLMPPSTAPSSDTPALACSESLPLVNVAEPLTPYVPSAVLVISTPKGAPAMSGKLPSSFVKARRAIDDAAATALFNPNAAMSSIDISPPRSSTLRSFFISSRIPSFFSAWSRL